MKILVQISRLLVGALFIFSGLIKANDPVGFGVKLEDYFLVFSETLPFFGAPWLLHSTVALAWTICVVEVALGIALLLGIWRKTVAWSLLLMILFFTWLTGYSAITGAVTDCGCFGDAIPLTPVQSFQKDLVLLALILLIFIDVVFWPKAIRPVLPAPIRWALFVLVTAFSAGLGIHALRHLPPLDFRPYKVGTNIARAMELPENAKPEIVQLTWVYKNKASGEIREFVDQLPEDLDAWEFQDRTEKLLQKGDEPPIHDFVLNDENGRDRTAFLLDLDDVYFFVISPELRHTSVKGWKALQTLQQEAESEGIHVFGLVGSGRHEIDAFRHEIQAAYPFFSVDLKALKTFIRADPGLVVMRRGEILAKYSWRDAPSFDALKETFFPERSAQQLADLQPGVFRPGQPVFSYTENPDAELAGFTVFNSGGGDATRVLLAADTMVWVQVRDVFEVTREDWQALLPVLQDLDARGIPYAVVSGSDELDLLPMRDASGLDFDYYFSDPDYLQIISESNIVVMAMVGGKVTGRWEGQDMPAGSTILP